MKLEEIAQLAGVSRTTASYVINGKARQYRVSDKTVERVMAVVQEYNYHPNAIAAGLRVGRTRSFGLVIPDLENASYTRIAKYLEREARAHGYQLLISCSEDIPTNEISCVEHLLQRQVDALIVSSSLPIDHVFYKQYINHSLPVVAFDRALDPEHFISVVGADWQDASDLAVALANEDLQQVLFFGAQPALSISLLREQGFRDGCQSAFDDMTFLYSHSFERHSAARVFNEWLQHHSLPDAIFTTSYGLMQAVMDVCIGHYQQLPETLTLATFGDNELFDFLGCPVLTSCQQHQQIASKILALVLGKLNKEDQPAPGLQIIPRNLSRRGLLSRVR